MSNRAWRGGALGCVGLTGCVMTAAACFAPTCSAATAGKVIRPALRVKAKLVQPSAASSPRGDTPLAAPRPVRYNDLNLRKVEATASRHLARRARRAAPVTSSVFTAPPSTLIFNGLNQPGIGQSDFPPGSLVHTPSDATGAIGPSDYVEATNDRVAVYGRSDLGLIAGESLTAFVGQPAHDPFDPQIQWDQHANRWLYLADARNGLQHFLDFGWSKTSDPRDLAGGWCHFTIDLSGTWAEDYSKLGHDDSRIIFGSNPGFHRTNPVSARIWVVPKPANGDTSCAEPSAFAFGSSSAPLVSPRGLPVFTPVPANVTDDSADGYVVATEASAVTRNILIYRVGGTSGSPTLTLDSDVRVPRFRVPPPAPQLFASTVIDTLDARLTQAVAHADPDAGGQEAIWTQHTVRGSGGRSQARWYELIPGSTRPRQRGKVRNRRLWTFNAAISPAANGTSAVIFYNSSSDSRFVDIRAQSRDSATSLNRMGGEIQLGASEDWVENFTCEGRPGESIPCRWGDYAGASPDPLNSNVVWGTNQLSGRLTINNAQWLTQNFAVHPVRNP